MNITSLGEARFPSPVPHTVSDQARIPAVIVRDPAAPKRDEVLFELAGPRAKLFFDPAKTAATAPSVAATNSISNLSGAAMRSQL